MDQRKIGAFLKQLRMEQGITQEQLAERFYVSNRTVSRWETGSNLPDLSMLVELAEFYDVDLRELVNGQRKEQTVDPEMKESLLAAAQYTDGEKERLLTTVTVISAVSAVTLLVYICLSQIAGQITAPVFRFTEGLCLGISLAAILCSVAYTTGLLSRLKQHNPGPGTKVAAGICIALCVAAFLLAVAASL